MTNKKHTVGKVSVLWLRRDLRLEDNSAAYHALRSGNPVVVVFIFDKNILDQLANKQDARLLFIHRELQSIREKLETLGSTLFTYYDTPENAWEKITKDFEVHSVYASRDYEPYARERDQSIYALLKSKGIVFHGSKDQVIFEKDEIMKDDGSPYTVFTPYSKKWKSKLNSFYLKPYPTASYFDRFLSCAPSEIHSLHDLGFEDFNFLYFPDRSVVDSILSGYEHTRDFPAIPGTTHLGIHLRFGTISIRQLVQQALRHNEKFLNELIWREFYQMILYHFPHTTKKAFKPAYDKIIWENDEVKFKRWCEGRTGYPLVDAGIRELNETGYMHNRVRMVVASFLTKHLLIDWRWGEAYFAEKLLDYDQASNVGGWQWSAGCGCDAAPYFRIFNPESQSEKFDAEKKYQKKWVPEIDSPSYPTPIVDHKASRDRCLRVFKSALTES